MRPRTKPNLEARLAACAPVVVADPLSCKGSLHQAFENPNAPLHLELGCGKGQFICALASRFPHVNFVAMEREANIAVIAAERAMEAGVTNVRFLIEDAKCLPELFLSGQLAQIYINFCDPWHKRRHYKRRLTYGERLKAYLTLLAPEGELWFKTDNEPLFRFSMEEFSAVMPPYFVTEDLHNSPLAAENSMTEYETYFSGLGQPIYSIRARKTNTDCI